MSEDAAPDRSVRYTREISRKVAEALGHSANDISKIVMEADSIEVTFRPTREEMTKGVTGVTIKALRV